LYKLGQEEQSQVEKFMDWKAEDGIWRYRVQWEGYGPLDEMWEPPSELLHLEDQLQGFYANYPNVLKPDDPLPVCHNTETECWKEGKLTR
jgi:hypothetical protein